MGKGREGKGDEDPAQAQLTNQGELAPAAVTFTYLSEAIFCGLIQPRKC